MYIDTHCHISNQYGIDPNIYIRNAKIANVLLIIASFCEKKDLIDMKELTSKFDSLYCSIGYHPEIADDITEADLQNLEFLLKTEKKVVAVGEIGLDYHWNKENKEKQIWLFRKQLELAEKYHLPVVIHSRESINEVYQILKGYSLIGVIHCFSGSLEMAKQFTKLGYLLGIGGVLTFKNSKLSSVLEQIPLEFLLLETDSPYLAPDPYRGEVNQSSMIPVIAKKISDTKNVPLEEVREVTTNNAIRIFDLDIKL